MPLIRPEAAAALSRWREVMSAALVIGAGAWLASRGGWVLTGIGGLMTVAALCWGLVALLRLRFARGGGAPGVVEVVEGQVAYFGPDGGGFVVLEDLREIALVTSPDRRETAWRLTPTGGAPLQIPVGAAGAERLFDAFAQLPGLNLGRVSAAAGEGAAGLLWRRPSRQELPRPGSGALD